LVPKPLVPDPIRRLPKPELHLHALGALRPETLVELARAIDAPILATAERALEAGYAFGDDLEAFVTFFIGLFPLVTTRDAFARTTFEILEDAAASGARHVELRWAAWSHIQRGADEDAMFEGIEAGRKAAERTHDVTSRIVLPFPRTLGVDVAEFTLDVALRRRPQGVVGLDIAGDESASAVDPRFEPVFARARAEGLGVTAHAGEGAGWESVESAVTRYGATRIGHGTRAVESPSLLDRLAGRGVVLEVCPTSNVALGIVPSVAEHPLARFLEAGVPCTVSTDDPTLFGTDLLREHDRLHEEGGVSLADLGKMAATGFGAAFIEGGASGALLRERLDALRGEALSCFEGRTTAGDETR